MIGTAMRVAIVKPDAAQNNTAFEAEMRMWGFMAQEYGYEVTIFADRRFKYRNERLEVKHLRRLGGRFWFPPYPALATQLRRYEVIVTADPSCYPYAIWAALAAKVRKSRLVLDTSLTMMAPSGETWKERLVLRLAKAIFDLAHRVIVPTPLAAERLTKLGLLPEASNKVVELGHPVDTDLFRPRDTPPADSAINILSVGKLIYEKGHHIVIEALADLLRNHANRRLLIAGEGPYRQTLEELCHKCGVSDSVSFLGLVPNRQLANIYRKCDVFVHHPIAVDSWEEYFGVAVVEAMSSGLPLVVSDCGSLRHVVPGGAGFAIPQGDREMLREKVKLLTENSLLRDDMGAQGRAFVCQRYSVPEVVRRCWEQKVLSPDG